MPRCTSCNCHAIDARLKVRLNVFGRIFQCTIFIATAIKVFQVRIARIMLARNSIIPAAAFVLRNGEANIFQELVTLSVVIFQTYRLIDFATQNVF